LQKLKIQTVKEQGLLKRLLLFFCSLSITSFLFLITIVVAIKYFRLKPYM
jgi:hypothetical protein